MKILVAALIFAVLTAALPNQTPIIGIFTQSDSSDEPTAPLSGHSFKTVASSFSYIAASYVKYIQMSGAQVIPLFAYSNKTYFDSILPRINGVLFPGMSIINIGGDVDLDINTTWTKNAEYVLKYGMEQNRKGNIFPIWGTCLGMQLLAYLTCGYDAKAIAAVSGELAVRNTLQIEPGSVLYKGISDDLRYHL